MAGISDYARNKILDQIFSNTAPSFTLTTLYFALTTSSIASTDTGTTGNTKEPAVATQYGAYARASSTNNATNWPAASSGSKTNAAATISFPTSTGGASAPVTVNSFFVADASTAGNSIAFGALGTAKSVNNGDTPSIAAGAATFTLA
jgi:hypothetical protein